MPEMGNVALRVLVVLISSTTGLALGSLIYYALFEETLIYKGSSTSTRFGSILLCGSVGVFLLTVLLLYLNLLTPIVISLLGMLFSKLIWNLGDGYRYAGRLFEVLQRFDSDDSLVREYLARAHTYRQVQDLRSVAQTMFVPGSLQMDRLDALIDRETQRGQ